MKSFRFTVVTIAIFASIGLLTIPAMGKHGSDKVKNPPFPRQDERFIEHIYQGLLERNPRPNETVYWINKLKQGMKREQMVVDFINSDEYFVRSAYQALLHRKPDSSGMDSYLRALKSGNSRADIIESVSRSPEFQNRFK